MSFSIWRSVSLYWGEVSKSSYLGGVDSYLGGVFSFGGCTHIRGCVLHFRATVYYSKGLGRLCSKLNAYKGEEVKKTCKNTHDTFLRDAVTLNTKRASGVKIADVCKSPREPGEPQS